MLPRLVAVASGLLLGACTVVGVRAGTEEPAYESLGTEAGLEIRRYGPRRAAETIVEADEAGAPVSWFYDPPWTIPALRRNEIAIPVAPRP
jgi:hypothetical protein